MGTQEILPLLLVLAIACDYDRGPRSPRRSVAPEAAAPSSHEAVTAQPPTHVTSGIVPADAQLLEEPLRVGGDVKPPVVIKRVEYKLPDVDPKKRYILGVLVLEATIDKEGNVRNARILKGPDNANSRAVLDAARQWKFKPATLHGKPVSVIFNLTALHFPGEPAT